MPVTVELSPEAQRMVDEADARWCSEHDYADDNPLLDENYRFDAGRERVQIVAVWFAARGSAPPL